MRKNLNILQLLTLAVIIAALGVSGACKKNEAVNESGIIAAAARVAMDTGGAASSSEAVEIVLQGQGVQNIVLDTIQMRSSESPGEALPASSAARSGSQVIARFAADGVLQLVGDASAGSHSVRITFSMTDRSEPVEVETTVTVGDEESEGLELEIDPDEWSMNYPNSNGTVEAFLRGDGLDRIDLTSIQMTGDNPGAEALAAVSASINNNHIHARFAKSAVLGLLLNPAPGTMHTVTVSYLETDGTERKELTAEITIEDDEDEGEEPIEPGDLELEIEPEEWNLNFANSSGTVEVFIEGEGFDRIDPLTVEMVGDDPAASPLAADSVSVNNDKLHARFAKSRVIDLLLNPEEGSTHTITIRFLEIDGTEVLELTAVITIEDDDDDEEEEGGGETGEYTLQLSPSTWNLNYDKSGGTITAFIRGGDLDDIDLDSFVLTGDNSEAEELEAASATREGNHVKVHFDKDQLLALLDDPEKGSEHTVTVSFEGSGGTVELSGEVKITGNSN